ncbi:hypothetical protein FJTKL_05967 [Diaporthe vaccinii]|uniref:Secreted protein n=1 Tax=Diaporthe vaccinii TaxID=105482 RepID=A0ABR4DTB0_9PEZI
MDLPPLPNMICSLLLVPHLPPFQQTRARQLHCTSQLQPRTLVVCTQCQATGAQELLVLHWCLPGAHDQDCLVLLRLFPQQVSTPGYWVAKAVFLELHRHARMRLTSRRDDYITTIDFRAEAALSTILKAWAGGHPDSRGYYLRALMHSEYPGPFQI